MRHILLTMICLLSVAADAQTITWSAAVSVAANTFANQHPRVVVNAAGDPVILWGKSSTNSAYFSRWTGSAFSMPMQINPAGVSIFSSSWAGPDIASKGDTLYVVYKGEPEDTGGIYVRRSTDGGSSFGMQVRVDNTLAGNSTRFPSISTDVAGQPIVAYMQFSVGFTSARWVVAKSMNWGTGFMTEVLASGFNGEPVCDCCPGTVVSSGSTMAMLYRNNWSNKRTSWTGISTNGGVSFPAGMEVDNTNWNISACPSSGPDGVIVDDTLYSAYMSGAGGAKVYYSKSKLSSMQAGPATPIVGMSMGIDGQNYPRIASDGKAVAIVWKQQENNQGQVGLLFAPNVQDGFPAWEKVITNSNGNYIENADVAIKAGVVHVVWEDVVSGTVKYQKGTFTPTGVGKTIRTDALILSPLPANEALFVGFKDGNTPGHCTLGITDITGRVVYERQYATLSGRVEVPTGHLPNGFYLVKISGAGSVYTQKFVVSHP